MENSFLYSKSISFLMGRTRPDPHHPHHEPAPPALSLSLSLCVPLPGGPWRLHGPMCQPPVFLSPNHLRVGPGRQPLTAFPKSLPVHLLCSGLPTCRHRFWPHPTTQTPDHALPATFPRCAARRTGWSLLRRWHAASACQPVRAGHCRHCATMPRLSSIPTSPVQTATCRMPCRVCACAGVIRRCARRHVQPPPCRVSFTRGWVPLLRRAAIAWLPRPGNPVQLRSDTNVQTIRAAPRPPHATSGRPTLACSVCTPCSTAPGASQHRAPPPPLLPILPTRDRL
jgi:hypothetical protein